MFSSIVSNIIVFHSEENHTALFIVILYQRTGSWKFNAIPSFLYFWIKFLYFSNPSSEKCFVYNMESVWTQISGGSVCWTFSCSLFDNFIGKYSIEKLICWKFCSNYCLQTNAINLRTLSNSRFSGRIDITTKIILFLSNLSRMVYHDA